MQIPGQRLLDLVVRETIESPGAAQSKVVPLRGQTLSDPEVEITLPDNLVELFQLTAKRNEEHWDRVKDEALEKKISELKSKTRDLENEIQKKTGLPLCKNLGDHTVSSKITKYDEGLFGIEVPDYQDPSKVRAKIFVDTTPGVPAGEMYVS